MTLTLGFSNVTCTSGHAAGALSLETGDTLTFTHSSSTAGTISLTDIVPLADVVTNFPVQEGGSFTVDGTAVSADQSVTASINTSYSLSAAAASGYVFKGWFSSLSGKLSDSAAYTYTHSSTAEETVWPLFVKTGSAVYYVFGGSYYGYLDEALAAAPSNGTVLVYESGTVYGKNGSTITIDSGKKLLVPYSANHFTDSSLVEAAFDEPERSTSGGTVGVFRKLTVPSNTKIICNDGSTISIDAWQLSSSGEHTGQVAGPYGQIQLDSGASIVMNSGSHLRCYGYITGNGTVVAKSGANVYEFFQIRDWRGGNDSSSLISKLEGESFLLSSYFIQNIEAPYEFHAGATSTAYATVAAGFTSTKTPQAADFVYLGSTGLFQLSEGVLTRTYDVTSGHILYDLKGRVNLGAINLSMSITGMGSVAIDSSKYVLNVPANLSITVKQGSVVTIPYAIKLLPDTKLQIDQGAKVTIGKALYLYDRDDWFSGTYSYGSQYNAIGYSPSGTRKTTLSGDSKLIVNGELIVSDGAAIYSTNKTGTGGNKSLSGTGTITFGTAPSSLDSGIVEVTGGNTTNTTSIPVVALQAPIAGISASASDYTTSMQPSLTYRGTSSNYWYNHTVSVTISGCAANSAIVRDSAYWAVTGASEGLVAYAGNGADFTFSAPNCDVVVNGKLIPRADSYTLDITGDTTIALHGQDTHQITGTTPATCTTEGQHTHTCECGGTFTEAIAKLNAKGEHTPGTPADCENPQLCTVCNEQLAPALGHSPNIGESTCATEKVCTVCNKVLEEKKAHTVITDQGKDATCTEDGLTEGSHCEVCMEVLVAQQTIPAAHKDDLDDDPKNDNLWCCVCGQPMPSAAYMDDNVMDDIESDKQKLYASLTEIPANSSVTLLKTITDASVPQKPMTISTNGGTYGISFVQPEGSTYRYDYNKTAMAYHIVSDVAISYEMTLNYVDLIEIVGIFNIPNVNDTVQSSYLKVWYDTPEADRTDDNCTYKLPDLRGDEDGQYQFKIPVPNHHLHAEIYAEAYVLLENGTVVTKNVKYSVKDYAEYMLSSESSLPETKTLSTALLHMVAAAERYFHDRTAESDALFGETQTLDDMIATLGGKNLAPTGVTADKSVERGAAFKQRGKSLLFENNISLVSVYQLEGFQFSNGATYNQEEAGVIFMTKAAYEGMEKASFDAIIENPGAASGTGITVSPLIYNASEANPNDQGAGLYAAEGPKLVAKELQSAQYYIIAYVKVGDAYQFSGVETYSVEQYIHNILVNNQAPDEMKYLVRALFAYERCVGPAIEAAAQP